MTAIPLDQIDDSVWKDAASSLVCECSRFNHHPDKTLCRQNPNWAVRLRHAHDCSENNVMMCQECLDEAEKWAASCIGYRCSTCLKPIETITDLVGPVVAL